MDWFTADTHLGHFNVLEYDNRPFESLQEMHTELIRRWNEVVQPTDHVWHLGDVALTGTDLPLIKWFLAETAGTKHLILGNHDRKRAEQYMECGFNTVQESFEYHRFEPNDHILLVHAPYKKGVSSGGVVITPWIDPGGLVLHGHLHIRGEVATRHGNTNFVNVGCCRWDYYPVDLATLKAIL